MLALADNCRYHLYRKATDMRKGFDGLCGWRQAAERLAECRGVFARLMVTEKVGLEHPSHLGGLERGGLAGLFTHKVVMVPALDCGEIFEGLRA